MELALAADTMFAFGEQGQIGGKPMVRYLLSAAILLLPISRVAQAGPEQAVQTRILVKSTAAWNGRAYEKFGEGRPELTVTRVTIPPHTRLPWHSHPMPSIGYILSGHITVEDRATGRKKVFRAGEAIPEQVNVAHRGSTDDEPVVIVVTYAGTAGQPTSVPIHP
jgi:quercetin dioxygenase-like cupin family protein